MLRPPRDQVREDVRDNIHGVRGVIPGVRDVILAALWCRLKPQRLTARLKKMLEFRKHLLLASGKSSCPVQRNFSAAYPPWIQKVVKLYTLLGRAIA